ncbi:MAG TPA: UbiA family prenyltransferase [Hyphomicrobiaceae bacterium]|nr:UbiA family prenyltransferase [Hyphomicrobiaceae bacterium]
MDDGGRVPESGLSVEVGIPFVVAERVAGGGLGLLVIALFAYVKASLPRLLSVAIWLLGGRACVERRLVAAGVPGSLSLSPRLAGLLARAATEGRPVYLASRWCSPLLQALVALNPGLAGMIVVPRGLGSRRGAADVLQRFPDGYDAVLQRRGAVTIAWNAPPGALTRRIAIEMSDPAGDPALAPVSVVRELAWSLRLHQCVKNLLVLVPLVLSGRFMVLGEISEALVAFLALSCVASGTYILNDIWDVADDRVHWSKKERPIASGRVSAATALSLAALLIPAGLALAAAISWSTCAALLAYLALTLAYSLYVKTVPFLDGFTLATLFTIRLGIGVASADAPPSPWLFVFSMFLFGSLSYAKRYTEISRAIVNKAHALKGRGYRPVDAPMVLTVGLAAGVGAVMIMVLYIVEEAFLKSFYGATAWLWGFPPLVFLFVVRIWLVTVRGEMMDDPVAFAVRDRASIGLLGLLLICFGMAWLGSPL